jgi:hypothetical protein
MIKMHIILACLLCGVCLQASVFNDVMSARLAGEEPTTSNYQNTFVVPEISLDQLGSEFKLLFDSKEEYIQRAKIVSSLNFKQLSEIEKNALIAWLAYTPPNEANSFFELSDLSLKNDILMNFISNRLDPEYVGQLMLHVVYDTEQSALWREYVLQYYVSFYEVTWVEAEPNYLSDLRAAFQAVLANCLFESSALCGTSFINLIYLSDSCPEFDLELVKQAAKRIACDKNTLPESRISALQLLGERGESAVTEIAAGILHEDPRPNAGVQLAALGVLKTRTEWHPLVINKLETFLTTSTHGRLRSLARTLLEEQ